MMISYEQVWSNIMIISIFMCKTFIKHYDNLLQVSTRHLSNAMITYYEWQCEVRIKRYDEDKDGAQEVVDSGTYGCSVTLI